MLLEVSVYFFDFQSAGKVLFTTVKFVNISVFKFP